MMISAWFVPPHLQWSCPAEANACAGANGFFPLLIWSLRLGWGRCGGCRGSGRSNRCRRSRRRRSSSRRRGGGSSGRRGRGWSGGARRAGDSGAQLLFIGCVEVLGRGAGLAVFTKQSAASWAEKARRSASETSPRSSRAKWVKKVRRSSALEIQIRMIPLVITSRLSFAAQTRSRSSAACFLSNSA